MRGSGGRIEWKPFGRRTEWALEQWPSVEGVVTVGEDADGFIKVGREEAKTRFGGGKYVSWGRPELLPTAIEHADKDYLWRPRFYKFQPPHKNAKK